MPFKKGDPNINRKGGVSKAIKPRRPKLTDEQRQILANKEDALLPMEFCMSVLRDQSADFAERKWAAQELMPYMHRKMPTAVDLTSNQVVTTVSAEQLAKLPQQELEKLMEVVFSITKQVEAQGSKANGED